MTRGLRQNRRENSHIDPRGRVGARTGKSRSQGYTTAIRASLFYCKWVSAGLRDTHFEKVSVRDVRIRLHFCDEKKNDVVKHEREVITSNEIRTCLESSSTKPIEALSTTDRLIIHNCFLHIYLLLFSFRFQELLRVKSKIFKIFHFGSDRIGSDRIGSDRIGSGRVGSDRVGSQL